jgi:glutaminyl-tRNA synthetase
MAEPPPKYFRLAPGRSVRIRYAGFLTCTGYETGPDGSVTEVRCTWDPPAANLKVKGTIHWVPDGAPTATVRQYDRLFTVPEPDADDTIPFTTHLNPASCVEISALIEPSLATTPAGQSVQFERIGYYVADSRDSNPEAPVFNRTVTLKDAWAKGKG